MAAGGGTIGRTTIAFFVNMDGVKPRRYVLNLGGERDCVTVLCKTTVPVRLLPLAGPRITIACCDGMAGIKISCIISQLTKAIETQTSNSSKVALMRKATKRFFTVKSSIVKGLL